MTKFEIILSAWAFIQSAVSIFERRIWATERKLMIHAIIADTPKEFVKLQEKVTPKPVDHTEPIVPIGL